jgi:hypothetical protein
MVDEHTVYVPWYEASPDGLDELALIKRTLDELRGRSSDGRSAAASCLTRRSRRTPTRGGDTRV